jgi:competence ComEA-like helix-hairpin-helix protein
MGALRWGARPTDFVTEPERIDLNRADRAQLLQLPGVGETLADRIEEYRRSHKGFQNVDELRQVRGIGLALLKRLRPLLEVQPYVAPDDAQDAAPPAATTTPKARKNAAPKAPKAVAPTAPTAKKKGDGPAEPINVNTASAEELQQLPHIGPTISARILQAREQRPFQSVDELRHVKGIGPKIMDELRPFVKVN